MIRKSLRHVLGVTALGTLVLVAGCSILPKSEPQTRYNLPATAMQSTAVQKNVSLYVAAPQANRLINSNRVLVQPTGSEIQIYKGTQWADNAPVLLRERFVQAFTDARLFNAVSSDAALKTDFALEGYLSHFQVQYQNDQPVVVVQFDAQLINRLDSSIVQTQRFTLNQPATDTSVPAVIQAFGLASDQLSAQLVDWLAK